MKEIILAARSLVESAERREGYVAPVVPEPELDDLEAALSACEWSDEPPTESRDCTCSGLNE